MPTPDTSRLQVPYQHPREEAHHIWNLIEIQRWGNALPFPRRETYEPTLSTTGTTWSTGNGEVYGEWSRSGDRITGAVHVTVGSTTTVGSGFITLSLPARAATTRPLPVGAGWASNAGTNVPGTWFLASPTTIRLIIPSGIAGTAGFTTGGGWGGEFSYAAETGG